MNSMKRLPIFHNGRRLSEQQISEIKKLKVHTLDSDGNPVRVTRLGHLAVMLRPYQVWNDNMTPRIWRGSGKTLQCARTIRENYKGSIIYKDGKPLKEVR